jgi:hypothetical protein
LDPSVHVVFFSCRIAAIQRARRSGVWQYSGESLDWVSSGDGTPRRSKVQTPDAGFTPAGAIVAAVLEVAGVAE